MRIAIGCSTCFVAVILLAQQAGGQSNTRVEVIRGTVTADSSHALAGIVVIVTMAPDRLSRQAITDSSGRYEIRFERGTGDYLVYSGPPGYRAFRRRIALGQTGLAVIDIHLVSEAAQLSAVRVVATKPRPLPDGGFLRDPTAVDFSALGLTGAVAPNLAGDLSSLALTVPGLSAATDGQLVVFGVAGQVSTTFNGTTLGQTDIPRDARTQVRVIKTAYDPSIGGFGGARINVEMGQGGRVAETFARATLDAPWFQFGDAVAGQLGQRFVGAEVNANADGPFGAHDAWYNVGIGARRTTRDAPFILDAAHGALAAAGVSPDSVQRAREIAVRQGIPITGRSIPDGAVDQHFSLLARVDHYPDPARYGKLWTNAFSLTMAISANRSDPLGGSPTSFPSVGRSSASSTGQMIGQWLHLTETYSTELTSSVTASRIASEPYLEAPAARVRVQSQIGAFAPVTSTFALGGSGVPTAGSSGATWENLGAVNFYLGSAHKVKLYARSQLNSQRAGPHPDYGVFFFNSLADLDSNQPASFSRRLTQPNPSSMLWSGAAAIGDLWQVTPSFQLQPGVRFESNHSFSTPQANPLVASTFGLPNTSVPNTIHASPRLGFAWSYAPTRASLASGTASTGRISLPPRAILSGGIGEFRNDLSVASLQLPATATGLPAGSRQLTCVGNESPRPDWRSFTASASSVPSDCADGSASVFADNAPNVALFDPSYSLARSWRASLRLGSAIARFRYSVDAAQSLNVNQSGTKDLNLVAIPQFRLADEQQRPVFVAASAIVPASGLPAVASSRRSSSFARVTDLVSDLHSTSTELTFVVSPDIDQVPMSVSYTLARTRTSARGFDDATFESPALIAASRGPYDVRNRVIVNIGRQFGAAFGLSAQLSMASGMPYTPIVGGDINGDGLINDEAFVFDPATVTDQKLAADLRTLLGTAPHQARTCLMRQLRAPAARNSCEGPWTSSLNAALSSGFIHVLDGRYFVGTLNFTNVLGGLDQLLHGDGRLQGWGSPAAPDRILYSVQGFDPASKRFLYAVNPRFGSTRASETARRSPFRVTLDVRVELGRPIRRQQFDRFREMAPLRQNHARAPVDSLRARLNDYEVGNYYDVLIRMRDSLLLTTDQVAHLQVASNAYMARADSAWGEVAALMASERTGYDLNDLRHRIDAVAIRVWAMQRAEIPTMRSGLSVAQLELVETILQPLARSQMQLPLRPHVF
jgi:hypothetical protein